MIDLNVPLPVIEGKPHVHGAKSRTYPFDKLINPGESFAVNKDHREVYRNVYQSMCGYRKKHGGRFVVREIPTADRRGIEVRCWRLPDEDPADA